MNDLVPAGKDPWSQLRNEDTADYAAFAEFCKLGTRRSNRVLASHLGVSIQKVNAIARKNDWVARADAYDRACNELHPSADDMSLEDTLAFQYAVGKAMLDMGVTALQLKNPASMRTADIVKLLQQGSEIQRKAAGITDTVSVKVESDAVSTINKLLEDIIDLEVEEEDEDV